jgi:hypothetical protein
MKRERGAEIKKNLSQRENSPGSTDPETRRSPTPRPLVPPLRIPSLGSRHGPLFRDAGLHPVNRHRSRTAPCRNLKRLLQCSLLFWAPPRRRYGHDRRRPRCVPERRATAGSTPMGSVTPTISGSTVKNVPFCGSPNERGSPFRAECDLRLYREVADDLTLRNQCEAHQSTDLLNKVEQLWSLAISNRVKVRSTSI